MAKIKIGLMAILAFVALACFAFESDIGQRTTPHELSSAAIDVQNDYQTVATIDQVIATYTAEIGVRELTGNNDGNRVEVYLASTGLSKGYAWCAAFVNWCFITNGIKTVYKPAWSPSWFDGDHLIYKRDFKLIRQPSRGDVFGIFYSTKNRIGHVGFIDENWNNDSKFITTVEGNTNEAGSREGDGVYRKRRLKSQIYAVSSNFV